MQRKEALEIITSHEMTIKGFGVKSLMLFGSVARDEAQSESDVDLLVEFDRPVGLFTFIRLKHYLEEIFDTSVDLGTPDSLKPYLQESVLRRRFVPSRDWRNRIRDMLEAIAEVQEFSMI